MTKNDFIYALKTCGCLYHNGQTYYEENELIRMLEDLEMLEEEKSLKDMTELEHAIKHIKTRADAWAVKEVTEALRGISERLDKALSQEPSEDMTTAYLMGYYADKEPCDDAISRKWLLDRKRTVYITDMFDGRTSAYISKKTVEDAPSVTQKSGKWIKGKDEYGTNHFTCPFCGHDIATKAENWDDNYCANCGAKMESEE